MFRNPFKKNKLKENEYRVVIPEEEHALVEWTQEELPAIGVINTALANFEPKIVFCWQLSIIIDFENLIENGMPSESEREIIEPFCDLLDEKIKENGNALFLSRITWNKTRQVVYRIYDPELTNAYLQEMIDKETHPRPFDYRIVPDEKWEEAEWYLKKFKT